MSNELVVELQQKMLSDIFSELEKNNTQFILDGSSFFGSKVLIDKNSIYFNKISFENLDTNHLSISDKPDFDFMISVKQLHAAPSTILYFEILKSKESFDFECYRDLVIKALGSFINKGLLQTITFKNEKTISYYVTPTHIYATDPLYFPFGQALPSEIAQFSYKYHVTKIIDDIDISLFFYMLENAEMDVTNTT